MTSFPFVGPSLHLIPHSHPQAVPNFSSSFPPNPIPVSLAWFDDSSQNQTDLCIVFAGHQIDFPFFEQSVEPFHPQPLTFPTDKLYNTTSPTPVLQSPTLVCVNLLTPPNQTQNQPTTARTNLRNSRPLGLRRTIPTYTYQSASAYRIGAVRSVFRVQSHRFQI